MSTVQMDLALAEAASPHHEAILAASNTAVFEYVKPDGTSVFVEEEVGPYQSDEDIALAQVEYDYFTDGIGA